MMVTTPEQTSPRTGLLSTHGEPIPLLGVRLDARLTGLTCDCTLTQRFRNAEATPIEAVYLFPLPAEAAVAGLIARVGERELVAEIEERERAFERYDDALAAGDSALLLDEERSDVFQLSIGNLLPGEEATVQLRLLYVARPDARGVRLAFPTTLTPRYSPTALSEEEKEEIQRITPPYAAAVPYGLTFELQVEQPGGLQAIESPSHPLRVELSPPRRATVRFAQQEVALDRELVVQVETREPRAAGVLAGQHHGREHLLLELYPDLASPATPRAPRRLTFLIDCSGSMQGDSIVQARRAVELCLRAMDAGDTFQIVCFGSEFRPLFPAPLVYGQATLQQAVAALRQVDANLGGTEILAPLQSLLQQDTGARLDLIVLTDGAVSNEDQVIELAGRGRGRWRIFAFGIGAGASEHLVRGLARNSGGQAEFIYPGERIEPKVLRQFARLDTPLLRDVKLDWGGLSVEQAPRSVPPLFSGDALIVAARLPAGQQAVEGSRVTLSALTPDGPRQWSATVLRSEQGEPLGLWWARQALRDLEDGEVVAGRRPGSAQARRRSSERESPPASALVSLSKEYGLVCRETSFVAIVRRRAGEGQVGPLELRRVPLLTTAGWHGRGAVAGPSGAAAYFCAAPSPSLSPRPRSVSRPAPAAPSPAPPASPAAFSFSGAALGARVGSALKSWAGFADSSACESPARDGVFDVGETQAAAHDDTPWYLTLLSEARADGSFPLGDPLARVAGHPLDELQGLAAALLLPQGGQAELVLATALTVWLLRQRAADEEPVWRLAVAKAEAFLAAQSATGPGGEALSSWLPARLAGG